MAVETLRLEEAVHAEVIQLPGVVRWARGLNALAVALRDPNQTETVLTAAMYLNAGGEAERAKTFLADPKGRRLYDGDFTLDANTVDYDALLALPASTLGHAYATFMKDRSLTPDLFRAGARMSPEAYLGKRMRQSHDIWHVVTGYETDVPGEIELQAFTYAQLGAPLSSLIAIVGTLRWMWTTPGLFFRVWRAYRRGQQAGTFKTMIWEELWTRPLADVQAELRCAPA